MFRTIIILTVCIFMVLGGSACWGPFMLQQSFNDAVDRFHDESPGGRILTQVGMWIPVIPFINYFCTMIDMLILNPISFFGGEPASEPGKRAN